MPVLPIVLPGGRGTTPGAFITQCDTEEVIWRTHACYLPCTPMHGASHASPRMLPPCMGMWPLACASFPPHCPPPPHSLHTRAADDARCRPNIAPLPLPLPLPPPPLLQVRLLKVRERQQFLPAWMQEGNGGGAAKGGAPVAPAPQGRGAPAITDPLPALAVAAKGGTPAAPAPQGGAPAITDLLPALEVASPVDLQTTGGGGSAASDAAAVVAGAELEPGSEPGGGSSQEGSSASPAAAPAAVMAPPPPSLFRNGPPPTCKRKVLVLFMGDRQAHWVRGAAGGRGENKVPRGTPLLFRHCSSPRRVSV